MFGYDFGDTWISVRRLRFAIRLSTIDNIYAPDPERSVVTSGTTGVTLDASGLIAGGGQLRAAGRLRLVVEQEPQGRLVIRAEGGHDQELCSRLVLIIAGMAVDRVVTESGHLPAAVVGADGGLGLLAYPSPGVQMPLFVLHGPGGHWTVLAKDDQIRRKALAVRTDHRTGERLVVLAHDEACRARTHAIVMPPWWITADGDVAAAAAERCADLERNLGIVPLAQRPVSPAVESIQVMLNLHGEHWTGHVFATYAEMADDLRWACQHIDGRRVLAFLAAWDGRYYRTYPEHLPSERLGGEAGLRHLLAVAHGLGVRVLPMLGGANLLTDAFVTRTGWQDAILTSESGARCPQDWIDWNDDLSREREGWLANFGHPALRHHFVTSCSDLISRYGFDGIFLDGMARWENTPGHDPDAGVRAWAAAMRERHPQALLMAEDAFDALWGAFDLYAAARGPLGPACSQLRYGRQAAYLSLPAANGSCGVHEEGWLNPGHAERVFAARPDLTIPTITLLPQAIAQHGERIAAELRAAAHWRMPTVT